jgi:hypothetical protein
MPGFDIGQINNAHQKFHKAEFRRKHRWRLLDLQSGPVTNQDFLQLKSAQRPSFTLSEDEVHHDQEVAYFAGKQTWDPIEISFYDAAGGGAGDISARMFQWVSTVSNINAATCAAPSDYKKTLKVQMTSAAGQPDETWILSGCWPAKSNWNELDYSTSEIQLVNITLRFDRAVRTSNTTTG